MKKYLAGTICCIIGALLFSFCYNYNEKNYPNEYYNVYLDDEFLGTVASKNDLLSYIEINAAKLINIKKLMNDADIDRVYEPLGLNVERVLTYNNGINSIEEVYSKIAEMKSFTIKGYEFTITDGDETKVIYVTDKKIFEDAVHKFIEVYVGKEEYAAYLNGTQEGIKVTGTELQNIYIQEDITVKEKQIPVDYTIYTNVDDLANFLVHGENPVTKKYKVQNKQMISDIALANEISNQEFLMSNPKYKSENSLIAAGTEVIIKQTNPQLKVIVERQVVEDQVINYKTIYTYTDSEYKGYSKTVQKGSNGLQRVNQREKIVNGTIAYVEPKGKTILKASVEEIILKGDRNKPYVGDLDNWQWPSDYKTISSYYGYRVDPITGKRGEFHKGVDIAGMGIGKPVYAANNGTIEIRQWHNSTKSFLYFIVINHHNGYYTLYAHLSGFAKGLKVGDIVTRGQLIGYTGSTGNSSGPHLHFELHKDCIFACSRLDPLIFYPEYRR